MLPSAAESQPPAAAAPQAPAQPPKPKPAGLKPPPETSVSGGTLTLNGDKGALVFQAGPGHHLSITKLSLAGQSLSKSGEECRVDVISEGPIEAKFSDKPNGAFRYDVPIPACPFSLDVLDGAVLVTQSGVCQFEAADCRAAPGGLWGPASGSLGADQTKRIERERARAEAQMRQNFRALMASAGKDKEAVKKIAAEQAEFSSGRETQCRSYSGEDQHGFCASRLTEARALALAAAHEAYLKAHPQPRKTAPKPKAPKPEGQPGAPEAGMGAAPGTAAPPQGPGR